MNVLFVFNSVTTAKRIEKTIAKYGVLSKVVHTPKCLGKNGCSHSVKVAEKNLDIVKQIVKGSGIVILGIYKEYDGNGVNYKELIF